MHDTWSWHGGHTGVFWHLTLHVRLFQVQSISWMDYTPPRRQVQWQKMCFYWISIYPWSPATSERTLKHMVCSLLQSLSYELYRCFYLMFKSFLTYNNASSHLCQQRSLLKKHLSRWDEFSGETCSSFSQPWSRLCH